MAYKKEENDKDYANKNNTVDLCFKRNDTGITADNRQKYNKREQNKHGQTQRTASFSPKLQCQINKVLLVNHTTPRIKMTNLTLANL